MPRLAGPITVGVVLAVAALVATDAGAPFAQRAPDPATCDGNAGDIVLCVSHGKPLAGRLFTGGYVWVRQPARTTVTRLSCDAKLGGRIRRSRQYGALYVVGGIRLSPILQRQWTRPDARGTRHLARATCGWRIPRRAHGLLLSLIQPREHLGDDEAAWGLHVETGSGTRECNLTSWRVGLAGPVTPAPRLRRVAC
jgi:hypothetical protein